jgi:hypothetical protein
VPRNEFIFAWLMVVTLMLILIMGVTVVVVWRSGLLTGGAPLVETLSESAGGDQKVDVSGQDSLLKATDSFKARVYCTNPATGLLAGEDRTIEGAPHITGRIRNLLESLRLTPSTAELRPALPPELQFRAVFIDREMKTLFVDLASLPDTWQSGDPIAVGLCLYAITNTVTSLGSDFQTVRFLIDGKEPETNPGGFLLAEAFGRSDEWTGGAASQ